MAPARLLNRLVDKLVGDLGGLHRHAQRQVVAQVDLGLDRHRRRELQGLCALELAKIQLGIADRFHACLIDGAPVEIGNEVIDRLVPDGLPPDRALDHRGGRLPGTEPGDAYAPGQALERCLYGSLDLVGGCLHLQGDLGRGLAFERDGHSGSLYLALGCCVSHLGTHVSGGGRRARTETRTRTGHPTGS